jgi:hypothetical protein
MDSGNIAALLGGDCFSTQYTGSAAIWAGGLFQPPPTARAIGNHRLTEV